MSKSFLTIAQAYTKLGLSREGNSFITKSQLVSTGKCDTSLLEKYGDNDFVVDDDIVKKTSSIIYEIHNKTFYGKTSDKLLKPFNPSKPFKIRCAVIFNNLNSNALNTAFIIKSNSNVNLTCCKANNNTVSNVNRYSYWFSADDLCEHHYGDPQIGQLFEYTFLYNGDNKAPITSSNLSFKGTLNASYKPRNLENDIIYFGYDPRNSDKEVSNLHFDYLIIEQE